jgi:hypothetical protein
MCIVSNDLGFKRTVVWTTLQDDMDILLWSEISWKSVLLSQVLEKLKEEAPLFTA